MEYECKQCNGTGDLSIEWEVIDTVINGSIIKVPGKRIIKVCKHCLGKGKLDWIENIFGAKIEDGIGYIYHTNNYYDIPPIEYVVK